MKVIELFKIVCGSEEEEWVFYFAGNKTKEEFEKDVKDCVRRVLDEKYKFVEVEKDTFVRVKAVNNEIVKKFIRWLRDEVKYKGKVLVDIDGDLLLFRTEDLDDDLEIYSRCIEECSVHVLYRLVGRVEPHKVIEDEDFLKYMKERGWERVEIKSRGSVWFYEWGGFVQDKNGKWYNDVWNWGYKEI